MRRHAVACLALALVLGACTEDPTAPKGTGGSNAGGTGGDGGSGGEAIEGATSVAGEVVDVDGAAIAQAQVALCAADACTTSAADALGAFLFEDVVPASHRFEARPPAADSPPSFGAITVSVVVASGMPFAFARPLVLPPTGLGKMLAGGPETLDVTDELGMTVNADELTLPAGVTSPYLAGVLVSEPNWPPNVIPETTVAMWVFNPYGAVSSTDIKVAINNAFGLPADQLVELHTVDHETGLVVKVAEGQVSADGQSITINGGIQRLTWLILALVT